MDNDNPKAIWQEEQQSREEPGNGWFKIYTFDDSFI